VRSSAGRTASSSSRTARQAPQLPVRPELLARRQPVDLAGPRAARPHRPRQAQEYNRTHTASGSRVGPAEKAKVALPSRIYVEGRHDAELVEKVWGADLRHVGVVVEYLGGIDDLPAIVAEFAPTKGRRLGVLVDHLVPGTKESRIVEQVSGEHVFVTGHEFIDIWAAVKPERLGLTRVARHPARHRLEEGHLRRARLAARHPGRHRHRLESASSGGFAAGRTSTRTCSPRSRSSSTSSPTTTSTGSPDAHRRRRRPHPDGAAVILPRFRHLAPRGHSEAPG
jgi:hypothetical protein